MWAAHAVQKLFNEQGVYSAFPTHQLVGYLRERAREGQRSSMKCLGGLCTELTPIVAVSQASGLPPGVACLDCHAHGVLCRSALIVLSTLQQLR